MLFHWKNAFLTFSVIIFYFHGLFRTFTDFQVFPGTFKENAKSRLSSRIGGLHSKIINLKNNYYEYMLHKWKEVPWKNRLSSRTDGWKHIFNPENLMKKNAIRDVKSYSSTRMVGKNTARLPLCCPPYPHGLGGWKKS